MTRRPTPRMPFQNAAQAVLPAWELSLVFVGEARARSLNRTLRSKEYIPNVLSYAVGARSGEIIICLAEAKRQAPRYEIGYGAFVLYLFIHGLLHLKGGVHGATMEQRERALVARFARLAATSTKRAGAKARRTRLAASSRSAPTHPPPNGTTNRNRHRHRHVPGKAGRRRRSR